MLSVVSAATAMAVAAWLTMVVDGPLSFMFAAFTIVAAYLFIVTGLRRDQSPPRSAVRWLVIRDIAADRSRDA